MKLVGVKFKTTCVKRHKGEFDLYIHFGVVPEFKRHYGIDNDEEVIDVEAEVIDQDLSIKELSNDQSYDLNSIDYLTYIPYTWMEFDCEPLGNLIIQPNIKSFNVCFPYGADASCFDHDGNRIGSICRLKITEIKQIKLV